MRTSEISCLEQRLPWLGLLLIAAFIGSAASGRADEYITQYRYRSFEGTDPPDWVSTFAASQTVLPGIVKVERGQANDAFQQFCYANFNGNKRYVCADGVPGNDLSQDFSVTAWLNLNTTNGTQTICSTLDPANQTGFRLSAQNGRLTGEAWFNTATARVRLTFASVGFLEADKWRRVAFRRIKAPETGDHYMDLWIDSARAALTMIPYSTEIDNSTLNPVFGANRTSTGFNDFLNAKVYAIQVDDYGLSDFFLSSPIIRDGSRYFGMPSYHDYIGEGADNKPLERRIVETHENPKLAGFRSRLRDRWMFPFANDNYVPQGFTSDQEGRRHFIAMYCLDEDDQNPGNFASIVAEILMPEGRLGNVFVLQESDGAPLISHVGGVVYVDGLLVVPDSTRLVVYDISTIPPATFNPDTFENFNPREIRAVQTLSTAADTGEPLVTWDSIAFMDVFHRDDHTHWMLLGNYNDDAERNFLYRLSYQKSPPRIFLREKRSQSQFADHMQGAATYYFADSVMRAFQAATGLPESRITDALYPNAPDSSTVRSNAPTILVPRGLEQLSLYDCKLWSVSESGARFYQKGTARSAPWPQCYPFFYSLDVQDRLDTNANRLPDQWEAAMSLGANADPNGHEDSDDFSNWQEYLADTDPRNRLDYPRIQIHWATRQISFDTSVLRFYTVESSTDLRRWTPLAGFTHRRGIDGMMNVPVALGARRFYRVRIEDK